MSELPGPRLFAARRLYSLVLLTVDRPGYSFLVRRLRATRPPSVAHWLLRVPPVALPAAPPLTHRVPAGERHVAKGDRDCSPQQQQNKGQAEQTGEWQDDSLVIQLPQARESRHHLEQEAPGPGRKSACQPVEEGRAGEKTGQHRETQPPVICIRNLDLLLHRNHLYSTTCHSLKKR